MFSSSFCKDSEYFYVGLLLQLLNCFLTRSCRWSINQPPLFLLSKTHKNENKHLGGIIFLPDDQFDIKNVFFLFLWDLESWKRGGWCIDLQACLVFSFHHLSCSASTINAINVPQVQTRTKNMAGFVWRLLEALKIDLQIKVGWVLKNSGNSLIDKHWYFTNWTKANWDNWV